MVSCKDSRKNIIKYKKENIMNKKKIFFRIACLTCVMMGLFTSLSVKSQNTCETAIVLNAPSASIPTGNQSGFYWYKFTPTIAQEGVYSIMVNGEYYYAMIKIGSCNNSYYFEPLFYAQAGITYYIRIDNYVEDIAEWSLVKESNPVGLTCQTASTLIPSDSIGLSNNALEYEWYVFTPTSVQEGVYKVSARGNSITLYGSCNDIYSGNYLINCGGYQDYFYFYFYEGTSYYFINSYWSDPQAWWSFIKEPTSDGFFCENARTVTPSNAIATGGWHTFTPTAAQEGLYEVSKNGNGITRYEGSCDNWSYSQYECDNLGGNCSFYFNAYKGRTYYFDVSPYGGGEVWSLQQANPEGMTCETARTISPSDSISATWRESNWYTFTPTAAQEGVYTVSAQSGIDIIRGYSGSSCNNSNSIFDIYCYSGNCITRFYAQEGTTYYFQIYNSSGEVQSWSMVKEANPESMVCETARNVGLSASIDAGIQGENWYAFTPSQGGVYTITLNENPYYSKLISIYMGSCSQLSSMYDGENIRVFPFNADAGKTYYIRYQNNSDTTQTWSLSKPADPTGLLCETAQTIGVSASIDADIQGENWYSFTSSQGGVYTIALNEYTYLRMYTGSCNRLSSILEGVYLEGTIHLTIDANKTYFINYYNYTDTTQTWSLSKPADPTGLLCEIARDITPAASIPTYNKGANWFRFTATQAGVYTTTEAGIYRDCDDYNSIGNKSFYAEIGETYYFSIYNSDATLKTWSLVMETNPAGLTCQTAISITPSTQYTTPVTNGYNWYVFTPTIAQEGVYTVNKDGGNFDIYKGDCNNRNSVGSSTFYAEAGKTYYLSISNYNSDPVSWSLEKEVNPENTFCQLAQTIVPSSNITLEEYDYTSRWYIFTPTAVQEGIYNIVMNFSSYYYELSKGSCDDLDYVERDGGYFYAEAGENYYFRMSNNNSESLIWSLEKEINPEGLLCETAKTITSPAMNITIDLGEKTESRYWYAFTPTKTAVYTVSNCGKGNNDARPRVYIGNCEDLNEATPTGYCNDEEAYSTFMAQAGVTYWIEWYIHDAEYDAISEKYLFIWDLIEETNTQGITCETATPTTGGTNIAAHRDVNWYQFSPTVSNFYSIFTNDRYTWGEVYNDCSLYSWENVLTYFEDEEDEKGIFYAEAGKTYYILCQGDGNNNYSWNLVVEPNPQYAEEVEVNPHKMTLNVGQEKEIDGYVNDGGVYQHAVWISRNPAIATVTLLGHYWEGEPYSIATVTGKAAGQTFIVFSATAGTETLMDSCLVTVKGEQINVTGVSVKQNTTILVNRTEQLSAVVSPANATNKGVVWESRNQTIAAVDVLTGLVTGIGEGETYIVVTTINGGFKDSCLVRVTSTEVSVTGVSLNKTRTSLNVGDSETLIATITPASASNQNISWQSDDETVATVDAVSGLVRAVSVGSAVVTVTTQDGNYTASCIVTVNSTGIINVPSAETLKIYPNPVQNTLYIQSSSTIEQVSIYDISGRMLQTFDVFKTSEVLDISHLSNGIYLLKIKTEDGEVVRKIVKQ
jgi:uncharacterized protein YjdB